MELERAAAHLLDAAPQLADGRLRQLRGHHHHARRLRLPGRLAAAARARAAALPLLVRRVITRAGRAPRDVSAHHTLGARRRHLRHASVQPVSRSQMIPVFWLSDTP